MFASHHHPPLQPRLNAVLPEIPGVWRAQVGVSVVGPSTVGLAAAGAPARPSGFPALDAELPAGGWPAGLVECLSEHPGLTETALLAPMCKELPPAGPRSCARHPRWRAWVVPERLPWVPHAPGWRHLGLDLSTLLWVRTASTIDAVWTIEQMVKGQGVHSVVWVAPQASTLHLRRVHWAARSAGVSVFAARPLACRSDASPAPLRLLLRPWCRSGGTGPHGAEQAAHGLEVEILKRQGPPLEAALHLPHPAPPHLLQEMSKHPQPVHQAAVPAPAPEPSPGPQHAVDCPASAEAAP